MNSDSPARCQPHPEDKFAPFLIAEMKGESDKFSTMICQHTDTVLSGFWLEVERRWKIRAWIRRDRQQGRFSCLGVGLKALLEDWAQNQIRDSDSLFAQRRSWIRHGFIPVYQEYANDTLFALGFEPALSNGSIICKRRGNRWYEIEVTGREAHAQAEVAANMRTPLTILPRKSRLCRNSMI